MKKTICSILIAVVAATSVLGCVACAEGANEGIVTTADGDQATANSDTTPTESTTAPVESEVAPADSETAPAESTANSVVNPEGKPNVNTGVQGTGAVMGVAVAAGIALVVAASTKKKENK